MDVDPPPALPNHPAPWEPHSPAREGLVAAVGTWRRGCVAGRRLGLHAEPSLSGVALAPGAVGPASAGPGGPERRLANQNSSEEGPRSFKGWLTEGSTSRIRPGAGRDFGVEGRVNGKAEATEMGEQRQREAVRGLEPREVVRAAPRSGKSPESSVFGSVRL